jgi:hypothetical protein|tara:strand:- start:90 stop:362 length:273 start_codon:yes stop_codon:yes gene_type:complete
MTTANFKLEVTGHLITRCSQDHIYTLPKAYNALADSKGDVQITDCVSSQADFCGVCEEMNPEALYFSIDSEYHEAYKELTVGYKNIVKLV